MPYIDDSETGGKVWSYRDRDQVIDWFSDQYRTAAERLARRVEEYLHDRRSTQYMDPVYLDWAVAMFDREKASSGGYLPPYDPSKVVRPHAVKPTQQFSAASVDVTLTPEHADAAGFFHKEDSE